VPFDKVLQILDDFLLKMPDSEKPPVMVNTLHKIVEQHSLLDSVLPSRPATKTDATNIDHTIMYPSKHLYDEVRSMGNPRVPIKRFKV